MGRAKLNMELISKEKSRNITFKKRKEGLIRKMHEFTTLCDVSACMIIYGPKQEKGSSAAVEPDMIWPQNPDEVHRIIEIYKAKKKDTGNKTFELSDFFHERKRKIEEEVAKLRKKNTEAKYPTWLELLNFMTEGQLREFAAALSNKAEYVKARIELLRRRSLMDINLMSTRESHMSFYSSVKPPPPPPPPIHYPPTIDLHSVNQNSMMMLLMNENDHCVQFGGGASATTGNIQCASFKRQVFYEASSSSGVVDPMICHSPRPLGRYYAPPLPLPPPLPYMMAPPQLQYFSTGWENHDGIQEDNVVQYHGYQGV